MAARRLVTLAAAASASAASPTCPVRSDDVGSSLVQRVLHRPCCSGFGTGDEELPPDISEEEEAASAKTKARWLALGQRLPASDVPPVGEWPFVCSSARRACFVENELVALDPAGAAAPAPAPALQTLGADTNVSFWNVPDPTPLSWFDQAQVNFNLPGYFDGLNGVQSHTRPIRARAASRSMETVRLWEAPVLNVTPIIVYPTWPFNFGDTMGTVFLHSWVQWASKHPGMWKHPLAVAIPHNLRLPSYWKLVESLGQGVESFSTLSKASGRDMPLCFERVVGCMNFGPNSWRSAVATDDGAAWESFRRVLVADLCPEKAPEARRQAPRRMVVGLVQRTRGRQLLNMDDLLQQCRLMVSTFGREVVCRMVQFSDVLTDICALQDIDVLIGTHGAQLVNALFMRPGSSLVEVRANQWYSVDDDGRLAESDSWPNTIAQKLWLTNNTFYWWYGVQARDSFPDKRSRVPGRDSDVRVSWPLVSCMLEKIAAVKGRKDYSRSGLPLAKNAGCKDALAEE